MNMRRFRDRDFIQTNEGFFFCVVGPVHPPDRVISYIKYVPSESGIWVNKENKFSRLLKKYTIPNLLETFNFLKQNYPQYLYYSTFDNITITAVPQTNIKTHFKPEQKLAQIRDAKQQDKLQDMLTRFIQFLHETSNVPLSSFGVTGSLLLDIHIPSFSDLDVIIYGTEESWNLKNALTEKRDTDFSITRLKGKRLEEWCLKKAKETPLSSDEALKLYERKWNLGFFEDRWVSIHPVKTEKEVTEKYGHKTYEPVGQVKIEATVKDNGDSLFLPATYKVEDETFLDGKQLGDVTEVVSYEGLYDSLAENGERIQVQGKMEKVTTTKTNKQYYRVLVGSAEGKGKEYIKLV
jgi:predicted nucleotidyltransferase